MAGASLLALLDDIASLLDDVALMTKTAAAKTTGVVGDDLAVNVEQVSGVLADRELPVVWAVAKGSFGNKCILIPLALLLSAFAPWLISPLLMVGGSYLCYEGAEKVLHWLGKYRAKRKANAQAPDADAPEEAAGPCAAKNSSAVGNGAAAPGEAPGQNGAAVPGDSLGPNCAAVPGAPVQTASLIQSDPAVTASPASALLPDAAALEKSKIRGAIRTDFVLSTEIIVVALGTVPAATPFSERAVVIGIIGLLMTVGVYGVVAAILKIDDLGLFIARRNAEGSFLHTLGHRMVRMVPKLMRFLTVAGTIAMFTVGGGILAHGLSFFHYVADALSGLPFNGILDVLSHALFGMAVGMGVFSLVFVAGVLRKKNFTPAST